jgi:omega-amidase
MSDLKIALVQSELAWEDPDANRDHFERALEDLPRDVDLVLLPEMFSTGFSMNAEALAEPVGGDTQSWLKALAKEHDAAVAGSLPIRDGDAIYNRLLFVAPNGEYQHYDKHHLFTMSGEHKYYAPGVDRLVVNWRGWRICPMVCYDLRFPVWLRNRPVGDPGHYDLIAVLANWPDKRAHHWRALLLARAIENQACCVGLNRVGSDGNGLHYSGDSLAYAADGKLILDCQHRPGVFTTTLERAPLDTYRDKFPLLADSDPFAISAIR